MLSSFVKIRARFFLVVSTFGFFPDYYYFCLVNIKRTNNCSQIRQRHFAEIAAISEFRPRIPFILCLRDRFFCVDILALKLAPTLPQNIVYMCSSLVCANIHSILIWISVFGIFPNLMRQCVFSCRSFLFFFIFTELSKRLFATCKLLNIFSTFLSHSRRIHAFVCVVAVVIAMAKHMEHALKRKKMPMSPHDVH